MDPLGDIEPGRFVPPAEEVEVTTRVPTESVSVPYLAPSGA